MIEDKEYNISNLIVELNKFGSEYGYDKLVKVKAACCPLYHDEMAIGAITESKYNSNQDAIGHFCIEIS